MYPDTLWVMGVVAAFLNLIIAVADEKHPKFCIVMTVVCTVLCIARFIQWKIAGVI